ncbi:MAG: biotin--[acetyl-CoA-carboxylase] ligase [bacterium]|nr:biotin--[acetyl-CoA-carboxylase] ligase [bacterium]
MDYKHNMLSFAELDSTNNFALKNIVGLSDRQVIIAIRQTAGRGRLGRRWISESSGNAYFTIVLKPQRESGTPFYISNITQYASVILCRILDGYGIVSHIKWPNDVQVNGHKLAGILSEASWSGRDFVGMVLGIGVNLNMAQNDLVGIGQPATALNLLTGRDIDRNAFIARFMDEFFIGYDSFTDAGFASIKDEYMSSSPYIGCRIAVSSAIHTEYGIAQGINDDGSLLLAAGNGGEKTIMAGDLIWLQQD